MSSSAARRILTPPTTPGRARGGGLASERHVGRPGKSRPALLAALLLALAATGCGGMFGGQSYDDGSDDLGLRAPGPLTPTGHRLVELRGDPGVTLSGWDALGDLDGDGRDELGVTVRDDAGQRNVIFYGRDAWPDVVELRDADLVLSFADEVYSTGIQRLGDFDGDGFADLGVQRGPCVPAPESCQHSGFLHVIRGGERRLGAFEVRALGGGRIGATPSVRDVKLAPIGDVNGDGRGDLGWAKRWIDPLSESPVLGGVPLVLGRSEPVGEQGLLAIANTTFRVGGGQSILLLSPVGDRDGDGFDDSIVVVRSTEASPDDSIWVPHAERLALVYGRASGFGAVHEVETHDAATDSGVPSPLWHPVALGDLDGDGFDDLGFHRGRTLFVARGGRRQSSTSLQPPAPGGGRVGYVATGDLDGDGLREVFESAPDGDRHRLRVIRGTSPPADALDLSSGELLFEGAALGELAIGDVDGDGFDDVLAPRFPEDDPDPWPQTHSLVLVLGGPFPSPASE